MFSPLILYYIILSTVIQLWAWDTLRIQKSCEEAGCQCFVMKGELMFDTNAHSSCDNAK